MQFYMKHLKKCILIILALALTNALADTVTVMPTADSGIEQHNPDFNLGSAPEVVSGTLGFSAGFEIRRALFQFNLQPQIPAGSTINSVTLRVSARDDASLELWAARQKAGLLEELLDRPLLVVQAGTRTGPSARTRLRRTRRTNRRPAPRRIPAAAAAIQSVSTS